MKILILGGGGMGAHSTNYFNFTLIFLIFISIFYTPPKKKCGWGAVDNSTLIQFFTLKFKKNLKVPPPPQNATSLWWRARRFIIFLQGLKLAEKKEQLINYKDSHFFLFTY